MSIRRTGEHSWQIRIYTGIVDGEEKYEYHTVRGDERDAQAEEARLKLKYGQAPDAYEGRNYTVEQFMMIWLRDYVSALAYRTQQSYRAHVEKRIVPGLGKIQLRRLGVAQIQRWLRALRQERHDEDQRSGKEKGHLSAQTVRRIHATLRSALTYAVNCGYLDANPADHIKLPKDDNEFEARPMSADELRTFFEAAEGNRFFALFLTCAYTGMRQGELLGLRWEDVDFEKRALKVRQSLKDITKAEGAIYGAPKSKKSRRELRVAPAVVAALRSHRAQQEAERLSMGSDWQENGLVFPGRGGVPMRRQNLERRDFKGILKKAGLDPVIRFHDLRHTNATLLAEAGVTDKVISERLGHSGIGITMNLYAHVLETGHESAANAIDDLLNPAPKKIIARKYRKIKRP